jgi:hypothetical protein
MSQHNEFPHTPGDEESLFSKLDTLSRPNPVADFHKKALEVEDITNNLVVPRTDKLAFAARELAIINESCEHIDKRVIVTGKVLERSMMPCEENGNPAYIVVQSESLLEDEAAVSEGYIVYNGIEQAEESRVRVMHLALGERAFIATLQGAGRIESYSHYWMPVDGSVEVIESDPKADAHTPLLEYFAPKLLTDVDTILESIQTDDEFLHELSVIDFSEYERFFDDPNLAEELIKYINIMHPVKKNVDVTLYGASEIIVPNEYDQACLSRAVLGSPLTMKIEKIEFSPPIEDQTQPKTAANSRLSLGGYVAIHNEKGEDDVKYAYIPLTQRLVQQQRLSFDLYD